MSKAYRKWKANIKAYRRGELPHCEHDYIILLTDTSMAAYRKIRRIRQRELKRMRKATKASASIEKWLSLFLPIYTEYQNKQLHQVSEEERIRQANELWRQYAPVH